MELFDFNSTRRVWGEENAECHPKNSIPAVHHKPQNHTESESFINGYTTVWWSLCLVQPFMLTSPVSVTSQKNIGTNIMRVILPNLCLLQEETVKKLLKQPIFTYLFSA